MITQAIQSFRCVRPLHQLLALILGESQPVIQLQLHTAEIKFAAHTERNATPVADEVLLKIKTMAGGLR